MSTTVSKYYNFSDRSSHHVHIENGRSGRDVVLVEDTLELMIDKLRTLFKPITAPGLICAALVFDKHVWGVGTLLQMCLSPICGKCFISPERGISTIHTQRI